MSVKKKSNSKSSKPATFKLQFQKICETGTGICAAVNLVCQHKVFAVNLVSSFFAAGSAILKAINGVSSSNLLREDWERIPDVLGRISESSITNFEGRELFASEHESIHKFNDVNGCEFAAQIYQWDSAPTFYHRKGEKEKAYSVMRKMFWDTNGYGVVLTTKNSMDNYGYSRANLTFVSEEEIVGFYPDNFRELYSYLSKFRAKKISRSLLLYGPPGTGKTTLAKLLAQKMTMKYIRIPVETLEMLSQPTLALYVEMLQPDAFIIDDFDKAKFGPNMNALLELFNKTSLLIASANNLSFADNDKSLIRPGRFDKRLEIKDIDMRVISDILGPLNSKYIDKVKDWPIAYIQELRNTLDALGDEIAEERIAELNIHVQEQAPKKPEEKKTEEKKVEAIETPAKTEMEKLAEDINKGLKQS